MKDLLRGVYRRPRSPPSPFWTTRRAPEGHISVHDPHTIHSSSSSSISIPLSSIAPVGHTEWHAVQCRHSSPSCTNVFSISSTSIPNSRRVRKKFRICSSSAAWTAISAATVSGDTDALSILSFSPSSTTPDRAWTTSPVALILTIFFLVLLANVDHPLRSSLGQAAPLHRSLSL